MAARSTAWCTASWTTACRTHRRRHDAGRPCRRPSASARPRLTAGLDRFRRIDLAGYHMVFGRLPCLTAERLIDMTERVDLRGRGGAAFPVARKLAAVLDAARTRKRSPIVLVNGAEGEPGSAKDRLLLLRSPYLVLGGALAAAGPWRRGTSSSASPTRWRPGRSAKQPPPSRPSRHMVGVVELPDRFVSGESGALVNAVNGRAALPSAGQEPCQLPGSRKPSDPAVERGDLRAAGISRDGGARGLRVGWYRGRARDGAADGWRLRHAARRRGGAHGGVARARARPVRGRASRGRAGRRVPRQLGTGGGRLRRAGQPGRTGGDRRHAGRGRCLGARPGQLPAR